MSGPSAPIPATTTTIWKASPLLEKVVFECDHEGTTSKVCEGFVAGAQTQAEEGHPKGMGFPFLVIDTYNEPVSN